MSDNNEELQDDGQQLIPPDSGEPVEDGDSPPDTDALPPPEQEPEPEPAITEPEPDELSPPDAGLEPIPEPVEPDADELSPPESAPEESVTVEPPNTDTDSVEVEIPRLEFNPELDVRLGDTIDDAGEWPEPPTDSQERPDYGLPDPPKLIDDSEARTVFNSTFWDNEGLFEQDVAQTMRFYDTSFHIARNSKYGGLIPCFDGIITGFSYTADRPYPTGVEARTYYFNLFNITQGIGYTTTLFDQVTLGSGDPDTSYPQTKWIAISPKDAEKFRAGDTLGVECKRIDDAGEDTSVFIHVSIEVMRTTQKKTKKTVSGTGQTGSFGTSSPNGTLTETTKQELSDIQSTLNIQSQVWKGVLSSGEDYYIYFDGDDSKWYMIYVDVGGVSTVQYELDSDDPNGEWVAGIGTGTFTVSGITLSTVSMLEVTGDGDIGY